MFQDQPRPFYDGTADVPRFPRDWRWSLVLGYQADNPLATGDLWSLSWRHRPGVRPPSSVVESATAVQRRLEDKTRELFLTVGRDRRNDFFATVGLRAAVGLERGKRLPAVVSAEAP